MFLMAHCYAQNILTTFEQVSVGSFELKTDRIVRNLIASRKTCAKQSFERFSLKISFSMSSLQTWTYLNSLTNLEWRRWRNLTLAKRKKQWAILKPMCVKSFCMILNNSFIENTNTIKRRTLGDLKQRQMRENITEFPLFVHQKNMNSLKLCFSCRFFILIELFPASWFSNDSKTCGKRSALKFPFHVFN